VVGEVLEPNEAIQNDLPVIGRHEAIQQHVFWIASFLAMTRLDCFVPRNDGEVVLDCFVWFENLTNHLAMTSFLAV
jgi:hypothetical protein